MVRRQASFGEDQDPPIEKAQRRNTLIVIINTCIKTIGAALAVPISFLQLPHHLQYAQKYSLGRCRPCAATHPWDFDK